MEVLGSWDAGFSYSLRRTTPASPSDALHITHGDFPECGISIWTKEAYAGITMQGATFSIP